MEICLYLFLSFFAAMGLWGTEEIFFQEMDHLLTLRLKLQADPKEAVAEICKASSAPNLFSGISCRTQIFWQQKGDWASICESPKKRYWGRYYRFILQCRSFMISGLKQVDFIMKT